MASSFVDIIDFNINIKKINYRLDNFPFSDYKILHLSDLHLGYKLMPEVLEGLINDILSIDPDIVVITGDLFEGDVLGFVDALDIFKKMTNQIETYFVFGNHDFQYNSIEEVLDLLGSLGIKTLINDAVWIGDDKKGFNLAGIADHIANRHHYPQKYRPDIEKSLINVKKGFPTILLSHRSVQRYSDKKYAIDLMLSGHIHGGQIYLLGLLVLMLKEDSGEKLFVHSRKVDAHRYVHISKGVGYTRLPFRLFVPPEISLITLNPL